MKKKEATSLIEDLVNEIDYDIYKETVCKETVKAKVRKQFLKGFFRILENHGIVVED